MRLGPEAFRDLMPDVFRAIQHYRETGEVVWSGPVVMNEDSEPACPVCNDIGRLAIRGESRIASYVDCLACDIAVGRTLAQIHPDFKGATLERYMIAAMTPEASAVGASMATWAETGHGSAALIGEIGALKTTLATAAWRHRVEHRMAQTAEWMIVPELLEEIRRSYDRESFVVTGPSFWRARNCELLLLDDLGAENINERNQGWVQEQLYGLINWRSNQRLATIFTSNLSLAQLRLRLGRAIVSRIEGMCGPRIWVLDQGVDYRRLAI